MADHERIWLQGCGEPACDDPDCRDEAGRTWCVDKIHDNDTEYVRADLFAELERENAALQAENADLHATLGRVAQRGVVATDLSKWFPESVVADLRAERDALAAQVAELERKLTAEEENARAWSACNIKAEAQVAELRAALERSGQHLVEMQRHRDRWRRFAKEGGEQPTDFIENSDSEGTKS